MNKMNKMMGLAAAAMGHALRGKGRKPCPCCWQGRHGASNGKAVRRQARNRQADRQKQRAIEKRLWMTDTNNDTEEA
jgi:hypothetical protein